MRPPRHAEHREEHAAPRAVTARSRRLAVARVEERESVGVRVDRPAMTVEDVIPPDLDLYDGAFLAELVGAVVYLAQPGPSHAQRHLPGRAVRIAWLRRLRPYVCDEHLALLVPACVGVREDEIQREAVRHQGVHADGAAESHGDSRAWMGILLVGRRADELHELVPRHLLLLPVITAPANPAYPGETAAADQVVQEVVVLHEAPWPAGVVDLANAYGLAGVVTLRELNACERDAILRIDAIMLPVAERFRRA